MEQAGAIAVSFSTLIVKDSIVSNNRAQQESGAIDTVQSYVSLTNTTFSNNISRGRFKDIVSVDNTNPGTFIRCDKGSPVNVSTVWTEYRLSRGRHWLLLPIAMWTPSRTPLQLVVLPNVDYW
jgi:hypothetical protein